MGRVLLLGRGRMADSTVAVEADRYSKSYWRELVDVKGN